MRNSLFKYGPGQIREKLAGYFFHKFGKMDTRIYPFQSWGIAVNNVTIRMKEKQTEKEKNA